MATANGHVAEFVTFDPAVREFPEGIGFDKTGNACVSMILLGQIRKIAPDLVVRNGYHAEREVVTAAGAVSVRQPRVNDKRVDPVTGERMRFSSAILPAWARGSPKVSKVLPLLYLHGLSTSDFAPALEQFLGTGHGLSAAIVTRLTAQWKDDAKAFNADALPRNAMGKVQKNLLRTEDA